MFSVNFYMKYSFYISQQKLKSGSMIKILYVSSHTEKNDCETSCFIQEKPIEF